MFTRFPDFWNMFASIVDISAVIKAHFSAPFHIRPQGVFWIVISDPKKTADFLQHQVDNLLLVRGLDKRGEMKNKLFLEW